MRPRPDTLFGTAARASIGRAGDEPVRMRAASHPPSQKVGIIVSLIMILSLFSPDVEAQQAHEHGVATLNVVLDGKKLVVQLESPLDNLVGFEHAPRNDKQRAALAKMEENLQAGDRWFKPAAAAGCTLRDVKVEHPYRTRSAAGGPPSAESGKGQKPDGKGKAAKSEEQHAEVRAAYELDCAKPEALDRMEVLLFDAFPNMKRLKAQMATPRGQSSATLIARKRTLSF
jgi:Protein of unknown function (DUF2796)